MALNKSPLATDPQLIKYQNMFTNRYRYFRWTPRTAWITFVYAALVPGTLMYFAYRIDGKYEFRGKRRGDTLAEF